MKLNFPKNLSKVSIPPPKYSVSWRRHVMNHGPNKTTPPPLIPPRPNLSAEQEAVWDKQICYAKVVLDLEVALQGRGCVEGSEKYLKWGYVRVEHYFLTVHCARVSVQSWQ